MPISPCDNEPFLGFLVRIIILMNSEIFLDFNIKTHNTFVIIAVGFANNYSDFDRDPLSHAQVRHPNTRSCCTSVHMRRVEVYISLRV